MIESLFLMYKKSRSSKATVGICAHGIKNPVSCLLALPCEHFILKIISLSKIVSRAPTVFQSAGRRKERRVCPHILRTFPRSRVQQFWLHPEYNPMPHTSAKDAGNINFILSSHRSVKIHGFYYCGRGEKMLGDNKQTVIDNKIEKTSSTY